MTSCSTFALIRQLPNSSAGMSAYFLKIKQHPTFLPLILTAYVTKIFDTSDHVPRRKKEGPSPFLDVSSIDKLYEEKIRPPVLGLFFFDANPLRKKIMGKQILKVKGEVDIPFQNMHLCKCVLRIC